MQECLEMTGVTLPAQLQVGCLRIEGADQWRLNEVVWEGTAKEIGVTFFCKPSGVWDEISLLRIEVFRLPAARKSLAERIDWYTRDRRALAYKLADGMRYDQSMLAMPGLGEEWKQDAFSRSRGEVIRIYQAKNMAFIFRFLARSGPLLTHPLFKRLISSIHYDPKQWKSGVPKLVEKSAKPRVKEVPLSAAETIELNEAVSMASKRLGLGKLKAAEKRLAKLEAELSQIRTRKKLNASELLDVAVKLGAALGQQFCTELGWEWRQITEPKCKPTLCVCSPDRRLFLAPLEWARDLLKEKKRALNCQLTFNMLKANRLPPSRPGSYLRIG